MILDRGITRAEQTYSEIPSVLRIGRTAGEEVYDGLVGPDNLAEEDYSIQMRQRKNEVVETGRELRHKAKRTENTV